MHSLEEPYPSSYLNKLGSKLIIKKGGGGFMGKYRIVAARPKNASNHLNSEFKLYEYQVKDQKASWKDIGWKTIHDVSGLAKSGNEVKTGKVENGQMKDGAAVELELRISKNDTNYKISDMPDA